MFSSINEKIKNEKELTKIKISKFDESQKFLRCKKSIGIKTRVIEQIVHNFGHVEYFILLSTQLICYFNNFSFALFFYYNYHLFLFFCQNDLTGLNTYASIKKTSLTSNPYGYLYLK